MPPRRRSPSSRPTRSTAKLDSEADVLAAAGFGPVPIASDVGLDVHELWHHYLRELTRARKESYKPLLDTVVRLARGVSGKYGADGTCLRPEVEPKEWAIEYLQKIRRAASAPTTEMFENFNPQVLDDDEWTQLKALLAKCGLALPDRPRGLPAPE